MTIDKVEENRIRRVAGRRGFMLTKSRRRDPMALDYGGYMLVDAQTNTVVFGGTPRAFVASLPEVAAFLDRPSPSAVRANTPPTTKRPAARRRRGKR